MPDLAGWRRERLPSIPAGPAIELAPDWVCEVLSPSTARTDRILELAAYAREGVPYAWYVDPVAHTLEVFRLSNGQWVLAQTFADDDVVHAEPFDAVGLSLGGIWRT